MTARSVAVRAAGLAAIDKVETTGRASREALMLARSIVHGSTALAGPSTTARAWFTRNDGRTVQVLQVTPDGSPWMPAARKIDASRASFVSFCEDGAATGSRRYYAGLRVVSETGGGMACEADQGDGAPVYVFYRLTDLEA